MPRTIIVTQLCDPCFTEDVHTEGETYLIRIGVRRADKTKELLLCERHRKELLDPLAEVLANAATYDGDAPPIAPGVSPVKPAKKVPGSATLAPSAARAGNSGVSTVPAEDAPEGHMVRPLTTWPKDLPEPRTGPSGETVFWCPTCEEAGTPVEFSTRERKRPAQSIRLHLRQQHQWDV